MNQLLDDVYFKVVVRENRAKLKRFRRDATLRPARDILLSLKKKIAAVTGVETPELWGGCTPTESRDLVTSYVVEKYLLQRMPFADNSPPASVSGKARTAAWKAGFAKSHAWAPLTLYAVMTRVLRICLRSVDYPLTIVTGRAGSRPAWGKKEWCWCQELGEFGWVTAL